MCEKHTISRALEYITLIVRIATVLVEAKSCMTAKICSDVTPYTTDIVLTTSCAISSQLRLLASKLIRTSLS